MIKFSYIANDYKCPTANPVTRYLNSLMAAEAKRIKGVQGA